MSAKVLPSVLRHFFTLSSFHILDTRLVKFLSSSHGENSGPSSQAAYLIKKGGEFATISSFLRRVRDTIPSSCRVVLILTTV